MFRSSRPVSELIFSDKLMDDLNIEWGRKNNFEKQQTSVKVYIGKMHLIHLKNLIKISKEEVGRERER